MPKCFIITPIGEKGSSIRQRTDELLDNIIKPVLEELGYEVVVPHEMDGAGSITNQIIQHIVNDEMVVANLTGLNPNVMYELAIRHCFAKPVVCVIENGTKLPFDIAADRAVFYENTIGGAGELKKSFYNAIKAISSQESVDNPVVRAIGKWVSEDKNAVVEDNKHVAKWTNYMSEAKNKVNFCQRPRALIFYFSALNELTECSDQESYKDFIQDTALNILRLLKNMEKDGKLRIIENSLPGCVQILKKAQMLEQDKLSILEYMLRATTVPKEFDEFNEMSGGFQKKKETVEETDEALFLGVSMSLDHTSRRIIGYGASNGEIIQVGNFKANYEVEIELNVIIQNESLETIYEVAVDYVPNSFSATYKLIDTRQHKLQPLEGNKHFEFKLRINKMYYDVYAQDVDSEICQINKIGKGISPLNGAKFIIKYKNSKHEAHVVTETVK